MRKLKKIMLVLMVAVTLCTMCTPMASAAYYDLPYTYTYDNGEVVKYNLDSDGNPYSFIDGEKVDLLLPLSKFKVTDSNLVNELNKSINITSDTSNMARAAVPTKYVDISATIDSEGLISKLYKKYVDLEANSSVTTDVLKINPSLVRINVTTADLNKKLLSGSKIKLTLYFYNYLEESWYSNTYTNNYTGTGKNYIFYPSTTPFIKAKVQKSSSGVKNFNLYMNTYASA